MLARELFIAENLEVPRAVRPFLSGQAVVYTTRAHDKETENEDAAAIFALDLSHGLLVVADGLGGLPLGQQASGTAVKVLEATLKACDNVDLLRECILNGIESANEKVLQLGAGAATTLALVEVSDAAVRTYHVGDSMILVCGQRGRLKLQTISHSPVGYAVESGMLDEAEAMHHEDRHIVSNVLGAAEMRIEMGPAVPLALRDTVCIASDGLFDNLQVPEIVDIIRIGPLVKAMDKLITLCQQRMRAADPDATTPSKPDDLTVILYRPV